MMADFRSSFKMTFSNLSLRLDTFTPRAAEGLRASIEARAHDLVAAVRFAGGCDFVTEVSADLPVEWYSGIFGEL